MELYGPPAYTPAARRFGVYVAEKAFMAGFPPPPWETLAGRYEELNQADKLELNRLYRTA